MAIVLTLKSFDPPKGGKTGLALVEAVLTTETYTNGTGYNLDLQNAKIPFQFGPPDEIIDVLSVQSNLGHSVFATKTATAANPQRINLRLWDGTTEISTAAYSPTLLIAVRLGIANIAKT
jgi:hypothetical protein